VIFGLFEHHLIALRIRHHGEVGLGARANHLRNYNLAARCLDPRDPFDNRIDLEHRNGAVDGVIGLLLQDIDEHLAILTNQRKVVNRTEDPLCY
jgi:hypothetical protein